MTVGDSGGCAGRGKGDTGRGGGREGAVGGQRFGDGTVKRDAACVLKRIEKKTSDKAVSRKHPICIRKKRDTLMGTHLCPKKRHL
jgi:hypothetical protein